MCIELDIGVCVAVTGSVPLLVSCASMRVSPTQWSVFRLSGSTLDVFVFEICYWIVLSVTSSFFSGV